MSDEPSSVNEQLKRLRGDLAIMRQAMGLDLYFGRGIRVFSMLLFGAAMTSAFMSLVFDSHWLNVLPFAFFMSLALLGLFFQSRRFADLSHEFKLQVILSITAYFAVIGAASGYLLAAFCGPSIGTARTIALYASSLFYILAFMILLVINALKSRERYYCFGLAFSLVLAGVLMPIFDPNFIFPLAHFIMAIGYLSVVLIQRIQSRGASVPNAAH